MKPINCKKIAVKDKLGKGYSMAKILYHCPKCIKRSDKTCNIEPDLKGTQLVAKLFGITKGK